MIRTRRTAPTTVSVLGELEVSGDHGPLPLGAPRQRAVLAALVLNGDRPLTTQRVITMVWGSNPPAYAVNLVHKYMSGLRRALVDLPPHKRVDIESGPSGYRLVAPVGQVDLVLFQTWIDAARDLRARGDGERAAELFGRALDLWRGPLLGELSGPAFDEEREFMETVRLAVLEEYATVAIEVGRQADVMESLREALRRHPLEENLARLLILALYSEGRTAEAVRVYQRLTSHMLGELNVPPRPELHDLYQIIRRHGPIPTGRRLQRIP
ncbi:AfsR/SARP family transcriptional regulator [Nocardiopsis lambiniae]|uniref:BTAD domain-containing putative transcriptional regulator n=1 Tax=Nocardiopsis lambiniae TaxID=3075539 RepID=A0ABU2MBE8_9ACTN|nr:BTAD domain-containing putative transcriptional regulator [Nocardiopsis sp. DSM 44743]MDT0329576.1 BTAD domain-containing putative transcriptional regulator [Nocardiopsis sp. DSM 44743]